MTTTVVSTEVPDLRVTATHDWEEARQQAIDSRDYTGGSALVEDKGRLIDRELLIIGIKRNSSDRFRRADPNGLITHGVYVSVNCVLREPIAVDGEDTVTVVFNDGGVGIEPVLRLHVERTQSELLTAFENFEHVELRPFLYCKRGLKASRYTAKVPGGSETAATTWYLT